MIQPGDFIRYTVKDELGLVNRVMVNGAFCWYHLGGTSAMTGFDIMELIDETEATEHRFSNEYAKKSLFERRRRLFAGEDVSDLIDI